MAGIPPATADPAACRATLIENLGFAATKLAPHGITAGARGHQHPRYAGLLCQYAGAIVRDLCAVGAPNLKMQMDCYHMQVMEGDIAIKLRRYAPQCGHIQIAGAPERHEPDTGEIRYEYLFRLLDEIGYDGWVGCEYRPAGKTVDGLSWFRSASAAA